MSRRSLSFFVLLLSACDGGSTAGTCTPAALECGTDLGSALPLDTTASTAGGSDSHGDASCAMGGGAGAPDVTFVWTAPAAGRYDISTAGSVFDTILTVHRGACDAPELACNDDGMTRQAQLTIDLEACETIAIVVDGFSAAENGDVHLTISGRESVCDDGIDDDGDGLVDCADTDCRTTECVTGGDWPADWAGFEDQVLELTNQRRAAGATCDTDVFGPAPPLEMDEVIRVAARLHSQDMATQDYFEHDSLDGRTFADRMRDAGFSGADPWGENIAAGQATPAEVVDGWMNSPGHCRNIMDPDYHVIGIGYAYDASSTFEHYWTQDFAGGH